MDSTTPVSSPVTVSRTSSLNQLFSSRRNKSRTTIDNDKTITPANITNNAAQPKPLSRQRSISDIMHRMKRSLKSTTSSPTSPHHHRNSSYSSKADDYDILRTIGAGATASVYSAIHKPSQSVIAIKTVNLEEIGLDDTRLDALRKEIQIMTLSKHPHILQVLQSFVHSSQLYIVTPIMSAGSCSDLLARCHKVGFEENIVACIIKQAAQGLEYLHNNELVHRDIKSANMLIDFDTGIVKLADFGVSNHLLSEPSTNDILMPPTLKKVRRSFVGTPCWMAPEILLNQDYDTKVDLWALGITCLELACGRPPYAEYDPMTIFSMIIDDLPPTLSSNGCQYVPSPNMQHFTERCLVKNPHIRTSVVESLSHPFLKKAPGASYLQKYLAKRPELNKTNYLMTRSVSQKDLPKEEDEEDEYWDEVDFLDTTWNFNTPEEKNEPPVIQLRPPPLRTNYARRHQTSSSNSPITPEDDNKTILGHSQKKLQHTNEHLDHQTITKSYF